MSTITPEELSAMEAAKQRMRDSRWHYWEGPQAFQDRDTLCDALDKLLTAYREMERERDAMKSARKVIAERLGVEAPKKVTVKRDPSEGNPVKAVREASQLANQIYDLLDKEGSMPLHAIAARLRSVPQGVARAISAAACADWFTRSPDGDISIAKGP